jgi:uncharacterized metal-binding protein
MNDIDIGNMVNTAVFGKEVEIFLNTNLGVYLVQCADGEIEKGVDALRSVEPGDAEAVRKAQNQVRIGEMFKQWVEDAVRAGLQAQTILEDRE